MLPVMYFFSDALYESPYNNLHTCLELHWTVPIATQVIPWSQCAAKFLVCLITHMHGPEHTSIPVLAYSKTVLIYYYTSSLKSGHFTCSNLYTKNLESLLFYAASHVPISMKLTIDYIECYHYS